MESDIISLIKLKSSFFKGGQTEMPYNINLKHLECFIKVAQLGSINKAAQALFISQPHLGKIIHDLENEMGYLLLNRSNQGVTLTPEGEEFLKHAVRVLEEMNCLRRPSIKTAEFNHLSVSMTKFSHVMESFIEVVLNHQDQPSFSHRLYEGNAEEVIDDVLSGRATVGVFHFDSKRRREMEKLLSSQRMVYRSLAYVEPHIVISKNHPLVRQHKPITLQALAPYGMIRYLGQYDDLAHNLFETQLQGMESNNSKVIYLSNRQSLMRLISVSDFYSIGIHDFEMQDAGYKAMSVPISGCDFMFEFGYVKMEGEPLSDITQEFIENVKARLN